MVSLSRLRDVNSWILYDKIDLHSKDKQASKQPWHCYSKVSITGCCSLWKRKWTCAKKQQNSKIPPEQQQINNNNKNQNKKAKLPGKVSYRGQFLDDVMWPHPSYLPFLKLYLFQKWRSTVYGKVQKGFRLDVDNCFIFHSSVIGRWDGRFSGLAAWMFLDSGK